MSIEHLEVWALELGSGVRGEGDRAQRCVACRLALAVVECGAWPWGRRWRSCRCPVGLGVPCSGTLHAAAAGPTATPGPGPASSELAGGSSTSSCGLRVRGLAARAAWPWRVAVGLVRRWDWELQRAGARAASWDVQAWVDRRRRRRRRPRARSTTIDVTAPSYLIVWVVVVTRVLLARVGVTV